MNYWYYFIIINLFFVSITADIGHVLTVDVQQDERIRLECTLTSKTDAEEVSFMKIHSNELFFSRLYGCVFDHHITRIY